MCDFINVLSLNEQHLFQWDLDVCHTAFSLYKGVREWKCLRKDFSFLNPLYRDSPLCQDRVCCFQCRLVSSFTEIYLKQHYVALQSDPYHYVCCLTERGRFTQIPTSRTTSLLAWYVLAISLLFFSVMFFSFSCLDYLYFFCVLYFLFCAIYLIFYITMVADLCCVVSLYSCARRKHDKVSTVLYFSIAVP